MSVLIAAKLYYRKWYDTANFTIGSVVLYIEHHRPYLGVFLQNLMGGANQDFQKLRGVGDI